MVMNLLLAIFNCKLQFFLNQIRAEKAKNKNGGNQGKHRIQYQCLSI